MSLLRRSLAQFAPHASDMRFCKGRGTMWASSPTEAYLAVRRGGALPSVHPPLAKFSAPFHLYIGLYFFANLTNTAWGASGKIYAFV